MTHLNDHPAYDNGEITATSESHLGGGRSDWVSEACQDFALNHDTCIEMMAFWEEKFKQQSAMENRNGILITKMLDIFDLILKLVAGFGCEQRIKTLLYALDLPAVDDSLNHWRPADGDTRFVAIVQTAYRLKSVDEALRMLTFFERLLGREAVEAATGMDRWTPAEGARIEGVEKFTMYKALSVYAAAIDMPPRKDQRSEATREILSAGLKAKYEGNRV